MRRGAWCPRKENWNGLVKESAERGCIAEAGLKWQGRALVGAGVIHGGRQCGPTPSGSSAASAASALNTAFPHIPTLETGWAAAEMRSLTQPAKQRQRLNIHEMAA